MRRSCDRMTLRKLGNRFDVSLVRRNRMTRAVDRDTYALFFLVPANVKVPSRNTVNHLDVKKCVRVFPHSYCHVISHWDDRNKITTILVFELTVASRQRMTVKNRCLYSVTSLGSPDTGRKKIEAKWLAGTLKKGSGAFFPSAKKEKRKS